MIHKILALFGTALFALAAQAQTISQPSDNNSGFGGAGIGQSFTATVTGTVVSIDVRSLNNTVATLYIYNGALGSGVPAAVGAPAYTQAGVVLTAVGSGGAFSTATLATPFPVTAGSTYTFIFDAGGLALFRNVNLYAGGTAINNFAVLQPAFDLAFQVQQVGGLAGVAGLRDAPTLGEWALFGLALSMALLGMGWIARRE
ncbi:hypothetical protein BWI17_11085 [Betaproteobacteria bacterium GR16-43]|nr:hypothetical protein BWI17_11085 [Betaproteobacteria bacterium GR16-43]